MSVRQGINVFLAGFVPSENMRFRDEELTFRVTEKTEEKAMIGEAEVAEKGAKFTYSYPSMTKTLGPFKLEVAEGTFKPSEIVMMLG
jgi:ATP-binding cassette subfamily E protein 1